MEIMKFNCWRHLLVAVLVLVLHSVASDDEFMYLESPTSSFAPSPSPSPSPSLPPTTSESPTSTTSSSSSTSTTTTTSTTSTSSIHPLPTAYPLLARKQNCMYLSASSMTFSFTSPDVVPLTNLSHLTTLYHNYSQAFQGCEGPKSSRTFQQAYPNTTRSSDIKFLFKFSFEYKEEDDMWSLNGLDCVNYTGRNHSFHYGECNYKFELPFGMSYKCSTIKCNGHEKVSGRHSSIEITGLIFDAFLQKDDEPSKVYFQCEDSSSSSNNNLAFIIVGLVIACTLVVAVLIIIGSFVYKRYKYGPYNLLD